MNSVQSTEPQYRRASKDCSRTAILNAAREIFLRDGYAAFSMRRLAADLGCAVGTPYGHFKSKQELFHTLLEQTFERLCQFLVGLRDRHQEGDPVVLLKKGMYTYIRFGLQNPSDYRLAFFLSWPAPDRLDRSHPVFEIIGSMGARCVKEGRFRHVDVETVAQALWAAIHGITSLLIQRPDFPWVGRANVIEQVINNAVDSLVQPSEHFIAENTEFAENLR
jgi:AcrR family transcriptional regulator